MLVFFRGLGFRGLGFRAWGSSEGSGFLCSELGTGSWDLCALA